MPKRAPSTPDRSQALTLAAQKLAFSDLTLEEADLLGIEVLTASQTQALGFKAVPSLKINYHGPDGKPMKDRPGRPAFFRLRYLAELPGFPSAKPQRYTQPADTVCCAYFPQNIDWAMAQDPQIPILITEGELKAASGCQHGYLTIGLGGVYNWRSIKKGIEFLPELEQVAWLNRTVYICFDSDFKTNPMVCSALRELAAELDLRGAWCHVAVLPAMKAGEKTGLDDLLAQDGPAALDQVLALAPALGLTKVLFNLSQEFCYVEEPGLILRKDSMAKVSPAAFKEHLANTKTYHQPSLKSDGGIEYLPVSAGAAWLNWPIRDTARRLTYRPGQPVRTADNHYNTWTGWGVQPKKGDVRPFLKLIDHIFAGAEEEAKQWFLRWLACPLQMPGVKMFSSAVLHGQRTGTGKSAIGYTMGRIYGSNFTEITQADLHASFNEWAEAKQLIMGDDVTGSNKRQDADILKKLITQRELRVNQKYVPSYTVPDCLNYLFTSNHADVFFLEDDDRRFFIHEVLVGPLPFDFYQMYFGPGGKGGWLDNGGAAAVFQWLLDLDLKGFDPAGHAFRTQARARMISDTQSDLGGWVRALLANPAQILGTSPFDLFTNYDLLTLYDPMGKTGTTANGLGRELRRTGVHQALQGRPVNTPDGKQDRYYIIRHAERWVGADHAQILAHLSPTAAQAKPKKQKF